MSATVINAPATTTRIPVPLSPLCDQPLVSVLMANYNYGRYLDSAVESVLAQSYPNWELIICDDGSIDESQSVLARLRARDPRITVLFKENAGQVSAWNRAYQACRGEVITLLDADDWDRADRLEQIVHEFEKRRRAGLLYHRLQPVDDAGNPVSAPIPDDLPDGWLHDAAARGGGYLFHATAALALRRELAELIFPMPTEVRNYGDVYIALTSVFLTEIASIQEPLTSYRQHAGSHSGGIAGFRGAADDAASGILAVSSHQQRFLSSVLGEELATRVSISDMRYFWEKLATLYVLDGKPDSGIKGFTRDEIAAHLPAAGRRVIWKVLFALPVPLSRRLLRIWMEPAWWKRLIRPLTGCLGLREVPAG